MPFQPDVDGTRSFGEDKKLRLAAMIAAHHRAPSASFLYFLSFLRNGLAVVQTSLPENIPEALKILSKIGMENGCKMGS